MSFQKLLEAFDVFNQASASLQESYQELQKEAHGLAVELAHANSELGLSLKEKESVKNYLKNILESLSNGVLVVGNDERVSVCNRAAARLLDLTRELVELQGRYQEYPVPEELKGLIQSALQAQRNLAEDLELQVGKPPSRQKFLSVSNSPVIDHQGRCAGVTIILKDITRLKELETQAQRAQRLQAMGEMAVQLAHEIRNPLGSIELFASLLGNELRHNPEHKRWTDQIVTGVKLLNTVVTNMLTFTRSPNPQFGELDLLELINTTLTFVEPVFQQRSVQVKKPAITKPILVMGDPEMLRQMLMNLFMNALQAMPERGKLSVQLKTTEDLFADIDVQDTGIGIPEENLNQIFDPFFTTHKTGTGLGLSLVHQIVTQHQGKVTAQSEFGKGTRFNIRLPLRHEFNNGKPNEQITAASRARLG